MTTQDNNEAASVQSATDEIMHEVANNPDRVAVRSKVAAEVRKAVEAASASQSSTPVPRVGGNTSNESPGLAHVARQRQESPDCGACPGDGSVCAESCRLAAESPSAAVAEGVDTALPELPPTNTVPRDYYTTEQMREYATTYGAQQREAGRREKQAEIDRLMLEFCPDEMTPEQKAKCARSQQPAAALARQLVSEGLTEYGRNIIKNAAKALRCASFNASAEDLEVILSAVPPAKAEGMSDTERATLERVVACAEILNKRPRPMCRDCGDEDGICPHSGLDCGMGKLLDDARAILAQQAKGETK